MGTDGGAGANVAGSRSRQGRALEAAAKWRSAAQPGADLRGILVIEGAAAVGATARLAIAEAIASVVRSGARRSNSKEVAGGIEEERTLRVEVTRNPMTPGSSKSALCFAYCVRVGDAGLAAAAHAALQREAALKGTRRLLPRFVAACAAASSGASAADTATCGDLRVFEWTVEHAAGPKMVNTVDLGDISNGLAAACPKGLTLTACCAAPRSNVIVDDITTNSPACRQSYICCKAPPSSLFRGDSIDGTLHLPAAPALPVPAYVDGTLHLPPAPALPVPAYVQVSL